MSDVRRRLRGIIGNALVWGIGWGLLGFLVTLTLGLIRGADPRSWLNAVGMGVKIGVIGGIAGTAFSGFIAYFYRGRRIQEISWVRFGLGGAVVSAVTVPLFMQIMNLLSGDGLVAWRDLRFDVVLVAVFGGLAAASSMKLAHIAAREIPNRGEALPDEPGSPDRLASGEGKRSLEQRPGSNFTPP